MKLRTHRRARLHLQGLRSAMEPRLRHHTTPASALASGGGFVSVKAARRQGAVFNVTELGSVHHIHLWSARRLPSLPWEPR